MVLPDTERARNDVIDLLNDAAKKNVMVKNEHGIDEPKVVLDSDQIYWSTRNIDNPHFGAMAKELLKLENMRDEAFDHMTPERANVFYRQLTAICLVYRKSIDAKSSETRMDKMNSKSNLIDKLLKQKSERVLSIEDKAGSSLADAFKGKQKQNEVE